jgi:hypothetical protein
MKEKTMFQIPKARTLMVVAVGAMLVSVAAAHAAAPNPITAIDLVLIRK